MKIYLVVNISQVKLYKECLPGQPANHPGPSHITEDQDKEYEVDYVIDSQWKGHKLEYLNHWKGYDNSKHMWELLSNLSHAKEEIFDFTCSHPNTLCCLNMAYLDFICLFH